jgi:hypothetical protein
MEKKHQRFIKLDQIERYGQYENEIHLTGTAYSKNWSGENVTVVLDIHDVIEWMDGTEELKEKYRKYTNKITD